MKEPVTKEQYEFYRSLYEGEERTTVQLEGRAKVYLGIVPAFLAAMVLKGPRCRRNGQEPSHPLGTHVAGSFAHDHRACAHLVGIEDT